MVFGYFKIKKVLAKRLTPPLLVYIHASRLGNVRQGWFLQEINFRTTSWHFAIWKSRIYTCWRNNAVLRRNLGSLVQISPLFCRIHTDMTNLAGRTLKWQNGELVLQNANKPAAQFWLWELSKEKPQYEK